MLSVLMLWSGCNLYRPIPSHGGGKRFTEEQRMTAAAIRTAVSSMKLESLASKRVNVNIVAMAQNGGGNLTMPGFSNLSVGYTKHSSDTNYLMPYIASDVKGDNISGNVSINASPNLWPTVFPTDQDLQYLEAALKMKFRHEGIIAAPGDAEETLYILIDVLGTNRSKQDSVIAWQDQLEATCEITYYVFNEKTASIVQAAEQVHAEGVYTESSFFGFASYKITREYYLVAPDNFPIDKKTFASQPFSTTQFNRLTSSLVPSNNIHKFTEPPVDIEEKLQQADSYIMSGNAAAAEGIINEIRKLSPGHPGIDPVSSRLQTLKQQLIEKTQQPPELPQ